MDFENKSVDHLKLLSRDQIIAYLKKDHFFHPPTLFDVKWFAWECLSEANQAQKDAYCQESVDEVYEDLIKARDKMLKADNPGEYDKWMRKVTKIRKQLSDREARWEELKKESERLKKMSEELQAYRAAR